MKTLDFLSCILLLSAVISNCQSAPIDGAPNELESTCNYDEYESDGQCFSCPTCRIGQGLSEPCGLGAGRDARCVACEEGVNYSDMYGVNQCLRCDICEEDYYRQTVQTCSPEQNADCHGLCIEDHYGNPPAPDLPPIPCRFCVDLPRDPSSPYAANCTRYWDRADKQAKADRDKLIVVIVIPVVIAITIIIMVLCVCFKGKVKNFCKCCPCFNDPAQAVNDPNRRYAVQAGEGEPLDPPNNATPTSTDPNQESGVGGEEEPLDLSNHAQQAASRLSNGHGVKPEGSMREDIPLPVLDADAQDDSERE